MRAILQSIVDLLGLSDAQLNVLGLVLTVGTILVTSFAVLRGLLKVRREQRELAAARRENRNYRKIKFQNHDLTVGDPTVTVGIRDLGIFDLDDIFAIEGYADAVEIAAAQHNANHPFLIVNDARRGATHKEVLKDIVGKFGALLPEGSGKCYVTLLVEKGGSVERFIIRATAYTRDELEMYLDRDKRFATEPGRQHQADRIRSNQSVARALLVNGDPERDVGLHNGVTVVDYVYSA